MDVNGLGGNATTFDDSMHLTLKSTVLLPPAATTLGLSDLTLAVSELTDTAEVHSLPSSGAETPLPLAPPTTVLFFCLANSSLASFE